MKTAENIKAILASQKQSLIQDSRLYGSIIQNSLMHSSLQRVEEMRSYQQGIVDQANHQEFKAKELKCLSCPNVLSCSSKC